MGHCLKMCKPARYYWKLFVSSSLALEMDAVASCDGEQNVLLDIMCYSTNDNSEICGDGGARYCSARVRGVGLGTCSI